MIYPALIVYFIRDYLMVIFLCYHFLLLLSLFYQELSFFETYLLNGAKSFLYVNPKLKPPFVGSQGFQPRKAIIRKQ